MTEMKRCTKCGEEKPATTEHFYPKKANTTYPLIARCRPCYLSVGKQLRDQPASKARASETAKRRYQRYKDDVDAMRRIRESRAKTEKKRQLDPAVKKRRSEAARERYHANRDSIRKRRNEIAKERYRSDAEFRQKSKERYKTRYSKNPLAFRQACSKRRALLKGAEGSHTLSEVLDLKKRQNDLCAYCGEMLPESGWHADHVIPLSRGGSNNIENIAIACQSCNCSKHDKLLHEWMPERFSPPDVQAAD